MLPGAIGCPYIGMCANVKIESTAASLDYTLNSPWDSITKPSGKGLSMTLGEIKKQMKQSKQLADHPTRCKTHSKKLGDKQYLLGFCLFPLLSSVLVQLEELLSFE